MAEIVLQVLKSVTMVLQQSITKISIRIKQINLNTH